MLIRLRIRSARLAHSRSAVPGAEQRTRTPLSGAGIRGETTGLGPAILEKTFGGSFSAVPTPIFGIRYSLERLSKRLTRCTNSTFYCLFISPYELNSYEQTFRNDCREVSSDRGRVVRNKHCDAMRLRSTRSQCQCDAIEILLFFEGSRGTSGWSQKLHSSCNLRHRETEANVAVAGKIRTCAAG